MESPKSYAAKLLQSKQSTRQKLIVFGCLALAVVIITTTVLVLHAQAMNYTRRVLECAYEVHEHTLAECGEPDARTCGLADYVVHVHNADCYDEDGKLACPLKEEPEHKHTAACYEDQKVLTCEQDGVTEEEAAALAALYEPDHVHTEECYVPGERVLSCGQEERESHAHTEACYAAGERVLSCGQEERAAHHHDDGCYTSNFTCTEEHEHTADCYTSELTCGQAEDDGHAHTDACYTEGAPVLACGQDEHEAHAHTDECYTEGAPVAACNKGDAAPGSIPEHTHTEACYETVSELTCGKLELHTHDDDCYWIIKPEDLEYQNYKDAYPEEASENKEIRILTCEIPQLEEHMHGPECFTEVELSPDEIAALKAQELGIELHDVQTVYEDADVRVTVDYDTLSLVPQPAEVALVNAATPLPEPTPNPLLTVDTTEPEAADDATLPEEGEPADAADAEPAPETAEPAPEAAPEAAATEAQPAASENEAPAAAPVAVSSEAPEVVRAGLMAEGREWLPAATVTYTVQYLDNGMPVGEAVQYAYTPGGEMPTFPRSIARYYRECRTDDFIVTARYTEFARIPAEAELRASLIVDEEQVAAYESAYKEALNTNKAQMLSLLDIGFWMDDAEVQPAAPVSITVQMLGEDGLPAGAPLAVVHFGEQTEVLAATSDDAGVAAFNMNSFSPVGIGQVPDADEEGRALLNEQNAVFEWTDPSGMYNVKFTLNGVIAPKAEEPAENDEDAAAPEEGDDVEAPSEEEAAAGAAENEDGEETAAPEADAEAAEIPLANASMLQFHVELLDEDSEAYLAYAALAEEDAAELLNMMVMHYTLVYGGVEMDLSDCEILVEAVTTPVMVEYVEEYNDSLTSTLITDEEGNQEWDRSPEVPEGAIVNIVGPEDLANLGSIAAEDAALEDAQENDVEALEIVASVVIGSEDQQPELVSEEGQPMVRRAMRTRANNAGIATVAVDDTLNLYATGQPNPKFTVEYWAWLDVLEHNKNGWNAANLAWEKGGSVVMPILRQASLPFLDTTDGKLPSNVAGNNAGFFLALGDAVNGRRPVATKQELTEIYASRSNLTYYRYPSLINFNALRENGNYKLVAIRVYRNSTTKQYSEYTYNKDKTRFTNRDQNSTTYDYITIPNGGRIQLIYECEKDSYTQQTAFSDYDITSGTKLDQTISDGRTYKRVYTKDGNKGYGINSNNNYSGSGVKYAFGNNNCGTAFGGRTWNGNYLNGGNDKSILNCAFGLVTGMTDSGNVQFADGISGIKNLFGTGSATGRKTYEGTLTFNQVGDTYTLTAASTQNCTVSGLDYFNNTSYTRADGVYVNNDHIWTNNFWPLDGVTNNDPHWGDRLQYPGSIYKKDNPNQYGNNFFYADGYGTLPISDDGKNHNHFFGMSFKVNFHLIKDYIGPLNYYFYGDDDMWVFLTGPNLPKSGKLICDIGGVHSSVGEYVNLWDYIPKGASEGDYQLTFFYTERGASGSSCWMQFTLPSVTSVSTVYDNYGDLLIEKKVDKIVVDGTGNETKQEDIKYEDEFLFQIQLANNGDDYACIKHDGKTGAETQSLVLHDGNYFTLKYGDWLKVINVPLNSEYTVTEIGRVVATTTPGKDNNYTVTSTPSDFVYEVVATMDGGTVTVAKPAEDTGNVVIKGTITRDNKNNKVAKLTIRNQYRAYQLPKTGGVTSEVYVASGAMLMMLAMALYTLRKRRKKAVNTPAK